VPASGRVVVGIRSDLLTLGGVVVGFRANLPSLGGVVVGVWADLPSLGGVVVRIRPDLPPLGGIQEGIVRRVGWGLRQVWEGGPLCIFVVLGLERGGDGGGQGLGLVG